MTSRSAACTRIPGNDIGSDELAKDAHDEFVRGVKFWQGKLNVTDAELARRLGVAQATVHNWAKRKLEPETGALVPKSKVSMDMATRVATALGIEVVQIYTREGTPRGQPIEAADVEDGLKAMLERLGVDGTVRIRSIRPRR